MAFFNKQGTLWKSLLNLSGQRSQLDPLDSLHNAAAANRVLIAEESVRPSLRGVLAIKIRMASLIKFDNGHQTGGFFVEFSIRSLVKRTQVAQNNEGILKWDQTKHFPIALVRNPKHPYNMLSIRLFSYDAKSSTDVSEVGSLSFHLHDIIKANPIAGTYDLWNANIQVGDIDLEFTFSYGSFGYGYSPQLREEDMSPEEIVTYSLFPRVIPRRDQREPEDPVMVVCATPHPRFIHFKEKVYLSYGREIREQLEEVAETMYRPDMLEQEMSDFEQVRDEYYSTTDRFARLTFLKNYLKGSTNQDEVMVELNDETNSEGDTQHRVLISKDYTRFVNSPFMFEEAKGFKKRNVSVNLTPQQVPRGPNMLAAAAQARKIRE